jgi:hypothetical protein
LLSLIPIAKSSSFSPALKTALPKPTTTPATLAIFAMPGNPDSLSGPDVFSPMPPDRLSKYLAMPPLIFSKSPPALSGSGFCVPTGAGGGPTGYPGPAVAGTACGGVPDVSRGIPVMRLAKFAVRFPKISARRETNPDRMPSARPVSWGGDACGFGGGLPAAAVVPVEVGGGGAVADATFLTGAGGGPAIGGRLSTGAGGVMLAFFAFRAMASSSAMNR